MCKIRIQRYEVKGKRSKDDRCLENEVEERRKGTVGSAFKKKMKEGRKEGRKEGERKGREGRK